jgi:fructuronate reductase
MSNKVNILHMGLGAFHRAHQAVYIQRAIDNGAPLSIGAVSQRDPKVSNQLKDINYRYTVIERNGQGEKSFEIKSIAATYFYPDDYKELAKIVSDPAFLAITITATEKAYAVGAGEHEALPNRLAFLLRARFLAGLGGITVISCDNIANNGDITKALVLQAAERYQDKQFVNWLNEDVRFANSMVDRIVPALDNPAVINTEPFIQWVIEDDPIKEYFKDTGVQFVADVAGYEFMKLRLFNAIHSALSAIGQLTGIEYIAQVVSIPAYEKFASLIQAQAALSFDAPAGESSKEYSDKIRARISNPTIKHRTLQVAMDGSQKLPFRIFNSINILKAKNLQTNYLTLVLAIWVEFLDKCEVIDDPLAKTLIPLAKLAEPVAAVEAIFSLPDYAIALDKAVFNEVAEWLGKIRSQGVEAIITSL